MFNFIKKIVGGEEEEKKADQIKVFSLFQTPGETPDGTSQGPQYLNEDLEQMHEENMRLRQQMRENMRAQDMNSSSPLKPKSKHEETKGGPTKLHLSPNEIKKEQKRQQQMERSQVQDFENDANKYLGPLEKDNKKTMNKKLKRKERQQQKMEEKQRKSKFLQDNNIFDFVRDFSSSDYESVDSDTYQAY